MRTPCRIAASLGLALLGTVAAVQAAIITVNPGAYGSYYSSGSVVRYGNYRLWDPVANNWAPVLGSADYTGVQTADFGLLVDGRTYQVKARDANVVIGSFTNSGGSPTGVIGQLSLSGSTLSFINQTVHLVAPARWSYASARIWCVSWAEFGIARFELPAGTWGGWYGNLGDGNLFSIGVASTGLVTVNSDSRGIGISGGLNQLVFPDNGTLQEVKWIGGGTPPGANFVALDWGTPNLPPASSQTLYLYSGQYSFISGYPTGGGSYWSPTLTGGNVILPMPTDPNYQLYTRFFTYHSASSGLDYTYALLAPEPSAALLLGLAVAGLTLRRRRVRG
jgi:hypothetical protein